MPKAEDSARIETRKVLVMLRDSLDQPPVGAQPRLAVELVGPGPARRGRRGQAGRRPRPPHRHAGRAGRAARTMTEIELSTYPDGVEWRVAFDGQTVAGGVLHAGSTQTAWHAALDLALEQVPEQ